MQPSLARRRQAIATLEILIERGIATPADLFLRIQLQEAVGDWDAARLGMQKLLDTRGDNPLYLASSVQALLRHDRAREATVYLKRLKKVIPDQPITVELEARVLHAQGQNADALKLLREFAKADEARVGSVGLLLEQLDEADAAEQMLRQFVDRHKAERPTAVLGLAQFLGRQGKTDEALDLCEAAWESCPPAQVSNSIVTILFADKGGKAPIDRVESRIVKAVAEHPDQISIQFDLANLRILQGRFDDAETIYRDIYKRNPVEPAPLNNLAWLMALRGGKGSEALTMINRAIEIAGEKPDLLDTRALARLAMDQSDAAIHDLEDAIIAGPNADIYFHMARAYAMAGRKSDARDALQRATEEGLTAAALHPLEREQFCDSRTNWPGSDPSRILASSDSQTSDETKGPVLKTRIGPLFSFQRTRTRHAEDVSLPVIMVTSRCQRFCRSLWISAIR